MGNIQKRYQFFGKNGIQWTKWFNVSSENASPEEAKKLNKERKWQVKNKLLNQFKYLNEY